LVAAVLAVAAAVAVLIGVLLLNSGSVPPAGSQSGGAAGTTGVTAASAPRTPSARRRSAPSLSALARDLVGSWHGVVTEYAPRGTQQQIEVRSQITAQGLLLAGQHSETTIGGAGTGQICEGRLRQRSQAGGTMSFSYHETLNPGSCISHTVISFAVLSSRRVAFQEIYDTKIGTGHVIGQLVR
jgi:hypothetical protein